MRKIRKAKLNPTDDEKVDLMRIAKSKTLPHREVIRANILLQYM